MTFWMIAIVELAVAWPVARWLWVRWEANAPPDPYLEAARWEVELFMNGT